MGIDGRGGKRLGAGRPRINPNGEKLITVSARVSPDVQSYLTAGDRGSMREKIESAVRGCDQFLAFELQLSQSADNVTDTIEKFLES